MKLIGFKPSFFTSSKLSTKKTRSLSDSLSSSSGSSTSIRTPKSVLSAPTKISPRDLEALLRRIAPGTAAEEAELLAMLAEASGGSGSGSEIDLAALGGGARAGSAELRETFAVFDVDGDGRISAEELMRMFAMLGDDECTIEDCRRMIGGVDSDSDGFVGFEDFERMMDGQI